MLHGSACCAQKLETTRLSFILTVKVGLSHFHFNTQMLLLTFAVWFGDPSNTPYGLNRAFTLPYNQRQYFPGSLSCVCVCVCVVFHPADVADLRTDDGTRAL